MGADVASAKGQKLTPLMEQYFSVKEHHPDKVVLFRMGDFFEMFHDDARVAAPILNIALTQRNKKSKDDTPMCGVPHHSIAGPIGKLLAAGKKIAICDQVEDPKLAKGLVKRAVTRCLSPGMVYDPDTLDQLEANYLCSYDSSSVSFLEATTGEAFYYEETNPGEQLQLIKLLSPAEVILAPKQKRDWFDRESLLSEKESKLPDSCGRLISYALTMQGGELRGSLAGFEARRLQKRLVMSPTVVRHLEIFETYKGEAKGSLFYAVNRSSFLCLIMWKLPIAKIGWRDGLVVPMSCRTCVRCWPEWAMWNAAWVRFPTLTAPLGTWNL